MIYIYIYLLTEAERSTVGVLDRFHIEFPLLHEDAANMLYVLDLGIPVVAIPKLDLLNRKILV